MMMFLMMFITLLFLVYPLLFVRTHLRAAVLPLISGHKRIISARLFSLNLLNGAKINALRNTPPLAPVGRAPRARRTLGQRRLARCGNAGIATVYAPVP